MFFNNNTDLGASLFKTWTAKQQREEVAKLVDGYRLGLPIGILFKMSETIAGNRKKARKLLNEMLTPEERQSAIEKETGGIQIIVKEYFQ